MPLTNATTGFDEDGFAAVVADIRKLYLLVNGGSNDMNQRSDDASQVSDEFTEQTVQVCTDAGEKTMKVMGTTPA